MIGVEKEKVNDVVKIVEDVCKMRKEVITNYQLYTNGTGMYMPYPMEVEVGGATIFVLDVDQFSIKYKIINKKEAWVWESLLDIKIKLKILIRDA